MLNNYKNLIILFLSLFIAGGAYIMDLRLDSAKSNLSSCEIKIDQQNDQIDSIQKYMQDKLEKQRLAEKSALKSSVETQEKIKKIMKTAIPGDIDGLRKWMILKGKEAK